MNEEDGTKKGYTGVWIPAHILDNEELTSTEKIMWAQITSLYNEKEGGCFASNKHLGGRVGVSEKQASNIISKLKKMNFVKQVSFDGRKRVIRSLFDKDGNNLSDSQ